MNCKKTNSYLIVISGPSGVGKATISKALLQKCPCINYSISATTRKPRPEESNGVDYWFMDRKEFQRKIKQDFFVEWAIVHGNYYGTPVSSIRSMMDQGQHVLLEIDVQGALRVKKIFQEQCLLFFILPPSFEELKIRLMKRASETLEEIERRLDTARLELLQQDEYDYTIINDDIDRAVNQVLVTLQGRLCIEK